MKRFCLLLFVSAAVFAQTPTPAPKPPPPPSDNTLLQVRRVFVEQLTGGTQAQALRELIISSLNNTKLFVLTDNEDRADAILKGAADDQAFTDSFDSDESINGRESGGKSGSGISKTGGLYGSVGAGDNESHHIKERKHEAYASVRLCNRDGDVLWSTTQESDGGKFRGASSDVAAKIAHQLTLDLDRERRSATAPAPSHAAGAGEAK
ncbi:MAG TPA: hypothetical protein VH302_13395 [Bryobacteraceae bacterium]|jgi:hypothetical protein|nr:hypothetical protein [Bryobacteraceae bacterium]